MKFVYIRFRHVVTMDLLTGSLILKETLEKNSLKLEEIFTLVSISFWATIPPVLFFSTGEIGYFRATTPTAIPGN